MLAAAQETIILTKANDPVVSPFNSTPNNGDDQESIPITRLDLEEVIDKLIIWVVLGLLVTCLILFMVPSIGSLFEGRNPSLAERDSRKGHEKE